MARPDRDELLALVLEDRAESAPPWRPFADAANAVLRGVMERRNTEQPAADDKEQDNDDDKNTAHPIAADPRS